MLGHQRQVKDRLISHVGTGTTLATICGIVWDRGWMLESRSSVIVVIVEGKVAEGVEDCAVLAFDL